MASLPMDYHHDNPKEIPSLVNPGKVTSFLIHIPTANNKTTFQQYLKCDKIHKTINSKTQHKQPHN